MRVVDLVHEEHYSEGEPDLEPPEELAVGELDDEAMLEEELDNEDIAEDDVDDEVLTATLEDLVHEGDEEDDADEEGTEVLLVLGRSGLEAVAQVEALEVLEVLEVDEIEDLEESLDRLLAQRLAMDGAAGGDAGEVDEGSGSDDAGAALGLKGLSPIGRPLAAACSATEFVCRSCFLVLNRAQLADPSAGLCHDCAS